MKSKTLFYCPACKEELLFEEVYDERLDFVYQPPWELPRICPCCGLARFKPDCITVMELYPDANLAQPAGS